MRAHMRGTYRNRGMGASPLLRRLVVGALLAFLVLPLLAIPSRGGTTLDVTVEGSGSGRSHAPGQPCADGGDGAYWHQDYRGPVPDGTLNSRPAELRLHLDVHSDLVRFPHADPDALGDAAPPAGDAPTAFLAGSDSRATFVDDRGTLQFALTSGDCDAPTLAFDGSTVAGGGSWSVHHGTGAYEGATGTGSFAVTAGTDPGADQPFSLDLQGPIEVLRPDVEVEVVSTYWGGLGADYLTRRPSVVYRISNAGPGSAFGAFLVETASPTSGTAPLGPHGQPLGDLEPGDEAFVTVRYQLGLLRPCNLVLLGCEFNTDVTVSMPDVLDDPVVETVRVRAKAPTLPPPL